MGRVFLDPLIRRTLPGSCLFTGISDLAPTEHETPNHLSCTEQVLKYHPCRLFTSLAVCLPLLLNVLFSTLAPSDFPLFLFFLFSLELSYVLAFIMLWLLLYQTCLSLEGFTRSQVCHLVGSRKLSRRVSISSISYRHRIKPQLIPVLTAARVIFFKKKHELALVMLLLKALQMVPITC